MRIPMFQVDAFTDHVFGGNPAAVCLLARWPEERLMQAVAAENNLSETAFLIDRQDRFEIRWFTPRAEIDLAGHPTLASAKVVFDLLKPGWEEVLFESPGGPLTVSREEDGFLVMDFPSRPGRPCKIDPDLVKGLGAEPTELLLARDHLAVFDSEEEVLALEPEPGPLVNLESMGVIATAPGQERDFVSRFFAPKMGIPEDPVTGSAHCTLIPYWSGRLGRQELTARQVSERVGELRCRDLGERVAIAGQAVLYLEGSIFI